MKSVLVPGVGWPTIDSPPIERVRQKWARTTTPPHEQAILDFLMENPLSILSVVAAAVGGTTARTGNDLLLMCRKGTIERQKVWAGEKTKNHKEYIWAYKVSP